MQTASAMILGIIQGQIKYSVKYHYVHVLVLSSKMLDSNVILILPIYDQQRIVMAMYLLPMLQIRVMSGIV